MKGQRDSSYDKLRPILQKGSLYQRNEECGNLIFSSFWVVRGLGGGGGEIYLISLTYNNWRL